MIQWRPGEIYEPWCWQDLDAMRRLWLAECMCSVFWLRVNVPRMELLEGGRPFERQGLVWGHQVNDSCRIFKCSPFTLSALMCGLFSSCIRAVWIGARLGARIWPMTLNIHILQLRNWAQSMAPVLDYLQLAANVILGKWWLWLKGLGPCHPHRKPGLSSCPAAFVQVQTVAFGKWMERWRAFYYLSVSHVYKTIKRSSLALLCSLLLV